MALSDDPSVITQAIVDVLDGAKADIGLKEVYYGDTEQIPQFPSVTVESGRKDNLLDSGATHRFRVMVRSLIVVYFGKIQSTEITKKATEEFSEAIEAKLHEDFTLGGKVIFGHVVSIEPGVAIKGSAMIRAARLSWEATSRKLF